MLRYNNILISEIPNKIVKVPEGYKAYAIFDATVQPVTSFGLYSATAGIEYIIEPAGNIHGYIRVPFEHNDATCHWIFDYVGKMITLGTTVDRSKLYECVKIGDYQTIFNTLGTFLESLHAAKSD